MVDDPKKEPDSPVRPASIERRSLARHPLIVAAETLELQSGTVIKARASDLSREGCYLDTINPFPVGTVVKLRLTKQKESFEVQAKAVYSQVGMGMGLVFTAAEPEQLWILEKWLAELSGELPPESETREQDKQARAEESLKEEQQYVLNDLIIALMRKGELSEPEGKAMLRKLHR